MERKPRFRFSSKIVVASVSAVVFYTLFIFYLELLNIENGTNIQVPIDLTTAWYAFWTVELVCLASIRKAKIKNKYEYETIVEEENVKELKQEIENLKDQLNDNSINDLNQKVSDLENQLNNISSDSEEEDDGLMMLNE